MMYSKPFMHVYNVVFVRKNDQLFEPRKVRLGPDAGQRWVVEAGLSADEKARLDAILDQDRSD